MERVVVYICGLWFWLTRRWRVDAYSDAAATLELAHAYLLRDFFSRASTRDRGLLLPFHHEALAILQNHAIGTYVAATRLANLRECCQFVSEELRAEDVRCRRRPAEQVRQPAEANPRPAALIVRTAASLRPHLALERPLGLPSPDWTRLRGVVRFVEGEASGCVWQRQQIGAWRLRPDADSVVSAESADQSLKAA